MCYLGKIYAAGGNLLNNYVYKVFIYIFPEEGHHQPKRWNNVTTDSIVVVIYYSLPIIFIYIYI